MAVGIWGIDKGLVTYAPKYTYDSNQMVSFISRGTYTFDNKYVLNASLRVDAPPSSEPITNTAISLLSVSHGALLKKNSSRSLISYPT